MIMQQVLGLHDGVGEWFFNASTSFLPHGFQIQLVALLLVLERRERAPLKPWLYSLIGSLSI